MDTQDKYEQLYYKKYDGMMLIDVLEDIDSLKDVTEQEALRSYFCNDWLYGLTSGYTKYQEDMNYESLPDFTIFIENVEKLNENRKFYWSIYYLYKKTIRSVLNV